MGGSIADVLAMLAADDGADMPVGTETEGVWTIGGPKEGGCVSVGMAVGVGCAEGVGVMVGGGNEDMMEGVIEGVVEGMLAGMLALGSSSQECQGPP